MACSQAKVLGKLLRKVFKVFKVFNVFLSSLLFFFIVGSTVFILFWNLLPALAACPGPRYWVNFYVRYLRYLKYSMYFLYFLYCGKYGIFFILESSPFPRQKNRKVFGKLLLLGGGA